jgi:1-pyrroline-5-carboxylate dehydrogenase
MMFIGRALRGGVVSFRSRRLLWSVPSLPSPDFSSPLEYDSEEQMQMQTQMIQGMLEQPTLVPTVVAGVDREGPEPQGLFAPHDLASTIGAFSPSTSRDVDDAIESALMARHEWATMTGHERCAVLLKAAELAQDRWRPLLVGAASLALGIDVESADREAVCQVANALRFNCSFAEALSREQTAGSSGGQGSGSWVRTELRPLDGFVYVATPNVSASLAMHMLSAPLAMGNTVVWKPATSSPMLLVHYHLYRLLEAAGLPNGVVNFVPAPARQAAERVLRHKALGGVHFAGTIAAGRSIATLVGANADRYDAWPRVVADCADGADGSLFAHVSADAPEVLFGMVHGTFEAGGTNPGSTHRAYVPRGLWTGLLRDLVIDHMDANEQNPFRCAPPDDPNAFAGPLGSATRYDEARRFIEAARTASDARIVSGGQCDDSLGYFVQPTVIEVDRIDHRLFVEPIAAPIIVVYAYDEALELDAAVQHCASVSRSGSGAALYANDRHAISHIGERLSASVGQLAINSPTLQTEMPGIISFGGTRHGGTNTRRGSPMSLLPWCQQHVVAESLVAHSLFNVGQHNEAQLDYAAQEYADEHREMRYGDDAQALADTLADGGQDVDVQTLRDQVQSGDSQGNDDDDDGDDDDGDDDDEYEAQRQQQRRR